MNRVYERNTCCIEGFAAFVNHLIDHVDVIRNYIERLRLTLKFDFNSVLTTAHIRDAVAHPAEKRRVNLSGRKPFVGASEFEDFEGNGHFDQLPLKLRNRVIGRSGWNVGKHGTDRAFNFGQIEMNFLHGNFPLLLGLRLVYAAIVGVVDHIGHANVEVMPDLNDQELFALVELVPRLALNDRRGQEILAIGIERGERATNAGR